MYDRIAEISAICRPQSVERCLFARLILACLLFLGAHSAKAQAPTIDMRAPTAAHRQSALGDGSEAALPPHAEVEQALKSLWETVIARQAPSGSRSGFDDRLNLQCVSLPRRPAQARESKADLPFQWFIELPAAATASEQDLQFRQKADALVDAGVMEKQVVRSTSYEGVALYDRYLLTSAGWKLSTTHRRPFCFAYGAPTFREFTGIRRLPSGSESEVELFAVTGKTGFHNLEAIEPWARSPAVLAAFPEIQAQLDGKDFQTTLARNAQKQWTVYRARKSKSDERSVDGPLPPEKEIKALIRQQNGGGAEASWTSGNACLPSSEDVDESVRTDDRHYAVAMIGGAVRKPDDRAAKALRKLDELVAAGVLQKSARSEIRFRGKASSPIASGYLYELTPPYRSAARADRKNCFHLGRAEVEFVAFKQELDNRGQPRAKYRILLKYPAAPKWTQDPRLVEHWADLRNLLSHGEACDGNFAYSASHRDLRGGGGSCWPAFSQE